MFNNSYKNKKVLITGHTGFKGSWLSIWLKEMGAVVTGYSLAPPTKPNMFESLKLKDQIRHHEGNILDDRNLFKVFHDTQPEVVFHLAAQPLVRQSYDLPKETYETNAIGTLNILETVRNCDSVKACIVITTDKCYENREWIYGYRETDPLGGYDPYSSSKACAELIVSAYRNSYFNKNDYGKSHHISLASVRAGNVIGGGDWAEDRLIPDCVRAVSENNPIVLRNPKSTRPWQHVLEPLAGYIWLGALMMKNGTSYSEGWNFGPYDESVISVEEVVDEVIRLWGKGEKRLNPDKQPHEAGLLKLDISKAQSLLKWRPVYGIKEAIGETVHWYREFYERSKPADRIPDMYQFTVNQINQYVKKAQYINETWAKDR